MTDHDEMVALGRYRVDLERDETGAWIATFPDVPGAHTYGRTLRQARGRLREALALWASDAGTAELDERIGVVDEVRTALQVALAAREDAERTEQDAIRATAVAVRRLSAEGLPVRDIADLIGLSPARVQQILRAPEQLAS